MAVVSLAATALARLRHGDFEVDRVDAGAVFAGGTGVEHVLGHAVPEAFGSWAVRLDHRADQRKMPAMWSPARWMVAVFS
ncbi:hypothetical protein HEK616_82750 (plasmid) [Streptomyces nigrescens]|uniref:Uncharacterized protein n=1 Tax=Streptomyces nigrescens TaxID=1920 RepID=A0ABN6R8V1_STRNI|nr:hypothetical protein HEK616_82750 [Streptomyces nigrescens]